MAVEVSDDDELDGEGGPVVTVPAKEGVPDDEEVPNEEAPDDEEAPEDVEVPDEEGGSGSDSDEDDIISLFHEFTTDFE